MPSPRTFLVTLFILIAGHSHSIHASEDGALLYAQNCAVCHGNHGNGGVGVPLALPDFQYAVTDRFLELSIRHGRPGRIMPAFNQLSDKQVKAIVKHIRSWAPGKPISFPTITVEGDPAKGKVLYQQNCAACHGTNGEGGKGTGVTFSRPRGLPIIAPALNNSGFLAAASDQLIKATLMNGREGTPMVSFLKQGLSEKDINNIVSYVRSFENQLSANPVPRENELAHTITYESDYSVEETVAAIKLAATGKNFRVIRIQNLDNGFVEENKEDDRKVIIYFCNFEMVNDALLIDPRAGMFLPCRVTVVEKDGKVSVHAINPKWLSYLFNNAELNRLCSEMLQTYISIIEEATL
ncbi:MAG: c-type cytochrome [Gammaproteobacteria bacterium]|nr:c-type cytochrome [Gammaproteobacteria bacterium]